MSPLRIIGYIGLALLSVIVLLSLYLSVSKGNWHGVAIGIGALILLIFLGNNLWLAGFKQKHPHVTIRPNQTTLGFLFVVLGVTSGAASIERFVSDSWLPAVISLIMAMVLFEGAYRVLKRN